MFLGRLPTHPLQRSLCIWHFLLFVLDAGRFGLREVRVPGHERADPESWMELYKWGQDSGTGHVTAEHPSPLTPFSLLPWWGLGLWNLTAMPSSFFQVGLRNSVLYLSLLTKDQKLVWRQFPCLALLPLQLVGTIGLRLVWVLCDWHRGALSSLWSGGPCQVRRLQRALLSWVSSGQWM